MKRVCHILATIVSLVICHVSHGADMEMYGSATVRQVADTSHFPALDRRLEEYLEAIRTEPAEIQKQEADFLIEVCSDSLIRQRTALKLYRHYVSSPVMGLDAVAIHLYDKWFATGKVRMKDDAELYGAKLFAGINRNSLIGCKAPRMELQDADGNPVTIMTPEESGWRILFFYDTGCPKCKLESTMLKSMFENHSYPVTLYAIYIGSDKDAWQRYVSERLDFDISPGKTVHLWDPDLTGNIGYGYGVFQTPKIFLVAPDGAIVGRKLDTPALEQLLNVNLPQKEHDYGSDASSELYDKVFSPMADSMTYSTVSEIAGYIEKSTLGGGDTLLFKQMTGDLLYYVTNRREEAFRNGTETFVDKYILSRGDIWHTKDDSLKIIGLASMLKGLASLAPAGGSLPDIEVHGTLKTSRMTGDRAPKVRSGEFRLSKIRGKGRAIIIFHTEGCKICEHEISEADKLLRTEKGLKVLEINMDELFSSYPSEADSMMRHFDLSSLPFIIELDSKGRVARKYISL